MEEPLDAVAPVAAGAGAGALTVGAAWVAVEVELALNKDPQLGQVPASSATWL
jgi:hypothetical protein